MSNKAHADYKTHFESVKRYVANTLFVSLGHNAGIAILIQPSQTIVGCFSDCRDMRDFVKKGFVLMESAADRIELTVVNAIVDGLVEEIMDKQAIVQYVQDAPGFDNVPPYIYVIYRDRLYDVFGIAREPEAEKET